MSRFWFQTPGGFRRVRSVPLSDRGFRYGMAVFETLRVDAGRVFFLREHLVSLRAACAACGFGVPDLARIGDLLAGEGSGVARVHVTAGDGGPRDPVVATRVFVGFEERPAPPVGPYRIRTEPRAHVPLFNGLKTHNYWSHAAALTGADEALLLSPDELLISAAMANVFVVTADGGLVTPGPPARAGILRGWVRQQRAVEERPLGLEALWRAREIFLTSSWLGVMPVSHLDGAELPSQAVAATLRAELTAFYDRSPQ